MDYEEFDKCNIELQNYSCDFKFSKSNIKEKLFELGHFKYWDWKIDIFLLTK